MASRIDDLTEHTFDETIGSASVPVIVDFWAEWCGPCKTIAPTLAEIAVEQADSLKVTKVNVDEQPSLARRYDVMSIPTLLVFHNGEPVKRIVGAKGKNQLLEDLADLLG